MAGGGMGRDSSRTAGGEVWGRAGAGFAAGALCGFFVRELDLSSLVSFWGDRAFFVPAGAALGALVALTPLRAVLAVAAGGLSLVWLAVAYTPLSGRLAERLVRREAPRAADAVFVFGSRLQLDGEPTPESMSRLLRGLELIGQGFAPRLVITELHPPVPPQEPLAREWMRTLGVEAELLALGPVRNTRDEALLMAGLCRERGLRRVLAVTSPTHSRRAAATLEKEGLEVVSVPAIEVQVDIETLDRPSERLRLFGAVLHESVGYVVYRRRGWVR
jgi:uncharacterized SAM-binding protein YcdF (DUF218 family)